MPDVELARSRLRLVLQTSAERSSRRQLNSGLHMELESAVVARPGSNALKTIYEDHGEDEGADVEDHDPAKDVAVPSSMAPSGLPPCSQVPDEE